MEGSTAGRNVSIKRGRWWWGTASGEHLPPPVKRPTTQRLIYPVRYARCGSGTSFCNRSSTRMVTGSSRQGGGVWVRHAIVSIHATTPINVQYTTSLERIWSPAGGVPVRRNHRSVPVNGVPAQRLGKAVKRAECQSPPWCIVTNNVVLVRTGTRSRYNKWVMARFGMNATFTE